MRFENFDRCYQVIRHLGSTEKTEEFLCTELNKKEHTACILVRLTDSVLAKSFTLFLDEKINDREFTDYLECFQQDGAWYAVFRYSLNQSLTERLQEEHCLLRERAEIARGLLERLLLLDPHPYFAWNALRPEQITVSRSLEVHWNYHLERVGQFDSCSMREVEQCLLVLFRLLFENEEKKKVYPGLEKYLQELDAGRKESWLELYQDFMPVYEELLLEVLEEQLPKTFWFRVWEKLKKFFGFCRKLLMAAILVAAVWYLIYILQDDSGTKVVKQTMNQIGDLMIEQQVTGQENENENVK